MVHIYCGDGKGKTTASVGLATRALGRGYKVIFTQFLKSGDSGEFELLKTSENFKHICCNKPIKFTFMMNEQELCDCKILQNDLFDIACKEEKSEKMLFVFDEIMGAMSTNLIEVDKVIKFINENKNCEIVLTGRNPSPKLIEIADYVSCINKEKHPFDNGCDARKGIEY